MCDDVILMPNSKKWRGHGAANDFDVMCGMDNIIFILQHDPERVIDLAPGRTARVINQLNIKKHVLIKSDLRPTHFRRDSNYHR